MIKKAIEELKSGLVQLYGNNLKHLFLYGSYARGDAVSGSDIDILMVLDNYENVWEEIQRTSTLVSDICLHHNIVISLIPVRQNIYNSFRTPLILNVMKEGIPL